MNIEELFKHDTLGIDVDDTLIGHPRSHVLQRFILEHHKIKNFHIVTFRTHGMEDMIDQDILTSTVDTQVPLRLHHFAGVHSIPYGLYENHKKQQWSASREVKRSPGGIILPNDSDIYYTWKAEKCREIGCTVLIDDMEPAIGRHCERIGILCLNPDHY